MALLWCGSEYFVNFCCNVLFCRAILAYSGDVFRFAPLSNFFQLVHVLVELVKIDVRQNWTDDSALRCSTIGIVKFPLLKVNGVNFHSVFLSQDLQRKERSAFDAYRPMELFGMLVLLLLPLPLSPAALSIVRLELPLTRAIPPIHSPRREHPTSTPLLAATTTDPVTLTISWTP